MIKEGIIECLNLKNLIDSSSINNLGNGKFLTLINIVKPETNNVFTKSKTFIRLSDAIEEIANFKESNENILYFNSYVEDLDSKITVYEIEEDYRDRELNFNELNIDKYQENSIGEKINNIILNIQNKSYENLNYERNEENEEKSLLEINKILDNILNKEETTVTRSELVDNKYNNGTRESESFANNYHLNNITNRIGIDEKNINSSHIVNDKQSISIKNDIKEIGRFNFNNNISSKNTRDLNKSPINNINNKKDEHLQLDKNNKISKNTVYDKKYYIFVMRKIEINTMETKNVNKNKINTTEISVVTDKLNHVYEIIKQQKKDIEKSVIKDKKNVNTHVKIIEMPKNKIILDKKKELNSIQKTTIKTENIKNLSISNGIKSR